MKDVALVINSVSKYKDVWPMFFGQTDKFLPDMKKYFMVDDDCGIVPKSYTVLRYNPTSMYRTQFVSCVEQIREEYCIYVSEDCVLYGQPDMGILNDYLSIIKSDPNVDFIKLLRGINYGELQYKDRKDLKRLSNNNDFFYTNLPSIWKTKTILDIHRQGPDLHIGGQQYDSQFEPQATEVCRKLGIQGLYCYHGENKRGQHHYDSIVWPFIATALVQGKWNMAEYPRELGNLLSEYSIDPDIRGKFSLSVNLRSTFTPN